LEIDGTEARMAGALKIAVLGLGVGYALSCAIAETGYDVVGIDTNPSAVANLRADRSVKTLLENKSDYVQRHLKLTTKYDAIAQCDIAIVCVSTGDERQLILGHVESAVRGSLSELRQSGKHATILVYSTLPFGSSRRIRGIFREENVELDKQISYCYMPLMIAQGTTASDFVNPPFIAFGTYTREVGEKMQNFYLDFIKRSSLFNGQVPPHSVTTPEIAELSKLVANAFLSTKISYANMVARFCEAHNLNGEQLLEIVGSDWRIGRAMLKPGYAFGGACFPRDLESLIITFQTNAVPCQILEATREVNIQRTTEPASIFEKIPLKRVLILGIAYKAGISDTRGSPSLSLAEILRQKGYIVTTFDPNLDHISEFQKLVTETELVIVTTNEPIFASIKEHLRGSNVKAIIDFAGVPGLSANLEKSVQLFKAGIGWVNNESNSVVDLRHSKLHERPL
jgi:UDPglucose 6-dehydrogenase